MIKILEKVSQKLNALAAKVFKKETYPYPPLSRRERRKFERGNIKAEKNIALCRRCMKNAPSCGGVQENVAISSLTENTSYLEIKRSSVWKFYI